MRIINDEITNFLLNIRSMAKEILTSEMGIKLRRSRFEFKGYLYPLSIVCFEHPKNLGQFDSSNFTISLNRALLNYDKVLIKNTLRHELAHYLAFLKYGLDALNHGEKFKEICIDFGWGEDVSAASVNLGDYKVNQTESKINEKIKKLLALADHSNEHESKLATAKANQLMLKHGIKNINNEEDICIKTVLSFKKRSPKYSAIYEILRTFYVVPVFSRAQGESTIEVTGNRDAVELAHYMADFLNFELERLWKLTSKENNLKGMRAKNSFFTGLAHGYLSTIKSAQNEVVASDPMALIKIENSLRELTKKAYKNLSGVQSSAQTDKNSYNKGKATGKNLNLRKGVTSKIQGLLSW